MKYKILLAGKNRSMVNDFFVHMDSTFECQTTSIRHEDIISHMKYFEPDAFVYCMNEEPKESITDISHIKKDFYNNIPLVIIGSQQDMYKYKRLAACKADIALTKPISVRQIQDTLFDYIEDRHIKKGTVKETKPIKTKELEELEKLLAIEEEKIKEEPRKHILVVDDDAVMLKVIKRHLSDKYDVATAVSGKVALKFLENKTTDLVLLDYEMPEEDGAAVLEKIRSREKTKDLPVIFLTGISDSDKIQQVLVLKPQGYLLKPVERDKLLEKIEEVIG